MSPTLASEIGTETGGTSGNDEKWCVLVMATSRKAREVAHPQICFFVDTLQAKLYLAAGEGVQT